MMEFYIKPGLYLLNGNLEHVSHVKRKLGNIFKTHFNFLWELIFRSIRRVKVSPFHQKIIQFTCAGKFLIHNNAAI